MKIYSSKQSCKYVTLDALSRVENVDHCVYLQVGHLKSCEGGRSLTRNAYKTRNTEEKMDAAWDAAVVMAHSIANLINTPEKTRIL